ncbi:MAG: hypothetical protein U0401_26510 [Anaerolineae bacterium]
MHVPILGPSSATSDRPMSPRWDILGLGVVTVDDPLYVDHYPQPNTKLPIRAKRREGGGLTATALVAAARLGASTAYAL